MSTNTSLSRRRRRRNSQRGMTLLEIMIVLAIIALVMGFLVGPAVFNAFTDSKKDVAAATAKKYAFEAYPQWSIRTGRACPDNLWTLIQYMNSRTIEDPWGTEYAMHCHRLPSGRPGILIVSAGEDERFGTDDDVRSDD